MLVPMKGLDQPTPLLECLAEGSPVVWWGWSSDGRARDRVRWKDLQQQVRRFLESIPLAPGSQPSRG
jgi:hypothetical protein